MICLFGAGSLYAHSRSGKCHFKTAVLPNIMSLLSIALFLAEEKIWPILGNTGQQILTSYSWQNGLLTRARKSVKIGLNQNDLSEPEKNLIL